MLKVLWSAPYAYEFALGQETTKLHPTPWVTELAKNLSGKVDLTIANWSDSVEGVETFENDGIHFIFAKHNRLRYDLLSLYKARIKRMSDYLTSRRSEFDIVHVHGTEDQFERVAIHLNLPFIVSIQGLINLYRPYLPYKISALHLKWILSAFYEKSSIKLSNNFICRTDWDTAYIQKLNPNATIYNMWEMIREDFHGDNYDRSSNRIIFIGGTNLFKGLREALRCFSVLNKRNLGMKLCICGSGKPDDIAHIIAKENLDVPEGSYEFYGYRDAKQLAALFSKSFCMIHPSYMDNSPNSICEAQLSGLPVIASRVGGVGSLIEDQLTGLFVERYDHLTLADQVCRLKKDDRLYTTISEASRRISRKRHKKEKLTDEILNIYNSVLRN